MSEIVHFGEPLDIQSQRMERGGDDESGANLMSDEGTPLLYADPRLRTSFPGVEGTPLLSQILSCIFCPLVCCGNCFQLSEREHTAVLYFGKYVGSVQDPGIHFLLPCGRELRKISTATRTMGMQDLKVVDLRGNPVIVSAVVTFEPTSAKKVSYCVN